MLKIISSRSSADNHSHFKYRNTVFIRKVLKTVKGGKNISFCAISYVGNQEGSVGVGYGKARNISDAIDKSFEIATKNVIKVRSRRLHNMNFKFCASEIIIRRKCNTNTKAPTYIIEMLRALGITNVSCKLVGSSNLMNNIFCMFAAIKQSVKIDIMLALRKKYIEQNICKNE